MSADVTVMSAVEEICAQASLTPSLALRLRDVARNNLAERKLLQARYAALDGESLAAGERAVRQAVFAWALGRLDQAAAALRGLSGPIEKLIRGELAQEEGRMADAVVALKAAAEMAPQEPLVAVEAAAALGAQGQISDAGAWLDAIEKAGNSAAELSFARGRLAERQGRVEEACTQYERALEQDPQHAEAAFRLAYHLDLRGEDERAIELYRRVTGPGPAFVSARINLGLLLEDKGATEEAIASFKEALRLDPANRRAALLLRDAVESLDMYYDETQKKENERLEAVLRIPISDFELSVRSRNCLAKMNVKTLGDLVRRSEHELLAFKNFGETSLNEIKNLLAAKGLRLGMFKEEEARKARAMRLKSAGPESAALLKPITDLELSVRARKCMQRLNVETIGDLVDRTEAELLATKNFGQTSLNEVKAKLTELGLSLRPA